ncbi:MAG TPA: hypothetical protein VFB41_05575 [Solirubrobacteraceae bacterium]|nr:hypothetical protein [Solirubrobacteraceae bacterium]
MDAFRPGQLVTYATGGPDVDGIVFAVPSDQKVVVAIVDPQRGPVLRTVDPQALAERTDAGGHDQALRGLIRRTPAVGRGGQNQTTGSVQGRRGHSRSATHRTTGK